MEKLRTFPVEWHFLLPVLCWLTVRAVTTKCVILGTARAAYLPDYLPGVPCASRWISGELASHTNSAEIRNLLSPWNCIPCSPSPWARLLPDVTQRFPIDSTPLFPNRFPRKPRALPACPRCSACHGMCCCQCPLQWLHPIFQSIPGRLHSFTPGKSLAQSINSDILSFINKSHRFSA